MKTLLKYAAFAAAAFLMGWVGLYLHWHFRLVGAVRTVANQPPVIIGDGGASSAGDANDILLAGGCRSLPYLVAALDKSNNQQLVCDWYLKILGMSLPDDLKSELASQQENKIWPSDTGDLRRQKVERLRTWWQANESRIHQGWKVWSSKCASE